MTKNVIKNFTRPRIEAVISSSENPKEQIPVIALVVSKDVIIEIDIDSFIDATTLYNNEIKKSSRIREHGKPSGRQVIWTINNEYGEAYFYVGYVNKKLQEQDDAEFRGVIEFPDILKVSLQYKDAVDKWLGNQKNKAG